MQKHLRRIDSWRGLHWVVIILSVLVVGPICSHPFLRLMDADGGRAVTMLISGDTLRGLLAGLAVLGGTAIVAAIGAYCCSAGVSFASASFVLAWGAWRTTDADTLIRRTRSGQDLVWIAIESLVLMLAMMLCAMMVMAITRARTRSENAPKNTVRGVWQMLLSSEQRDPGSAMVTASVVGVTSLAVGLVVSIACVSTLKGQAVFATFVGGIAAGWGAQLVARAMHCTPSPTLVMLGFVLPAVAGPLVAKVMHGDTVTAALFAGQLFPLARVMPFDWAAGAMMGVPVGLSWAGAMIDQRAADEG